MEPEPLHTVPPPLLNNNTAHVGSSNRLLYWTVALGAVAALLSTYLLFGAKLPTNEKKLLLGLDFGSGTALYTYQKNAKGAPSLQRATLRVEGKDLQIIDAVQLDENTYYLIRDTDTSINVFLKNKEGITRITQSNTYKRHLSVSEEKGVLSYEFASAPSSITMPWDIAVYAIESKKETVMHIPSLNSHLAANGTGVLFVASSTLEFVTLDGSERMQVLENINPKTVAFSETATLFSVFDTVSRAVSTYSFTPAKGVSFVSASRPLIQVPVALRYLDTELYSITLSKRGAEKIALLENTQTWKTTTITLPIQTGVVTSFTYE